jgi:hypothetical protein
MGKGAKCTTCRMFAAHVFAKVWCVTTHIAKARKPKFLRPLRRHLELDGREFPAPMKRSGRLSRFITYQHKQRGSNPLDTSDTSRRCSFGWTSLLLSGPFPAPFRPGFCWRGASLLVEPQHGPEVLIAHGLVAALCLWCLRVVGGWWPPAASPPPCSCPPALPSPSPSAWLT